MFSIILDVHKDISVPLSISGYNSEKLTREVKELLAVSFFERRILSLGQAAKIAELHLWDFIQLLNRKEIPIAEYEDAEIQQVLSTVKSLLQDT